MPQARDRAAGGKEKYGGVEVEGDEAPAVVGEAGKERLATQSKSTTFNNAPGCLAPLKGWYTAP